MRHAFRALVLSAALAALVGSAGLAPAPALQKEKKTDDKKAADKKGDEVGTIEVWKAKDGWRFKVLNTSGKTVALGYPHDKKEDALKDVELLKTTLNKGKVEVKDEKK